MWAPTQRWVVGGATRLGYGGLIVTDESGFKLMPIVSGVVIAGGVAFVALLLYRKWEQMRGEERDTARKFVTVPVNAIQPGKKPQPKHA